VLSHFRCFLPLPQLTEEYDRVTLLVYLDRDPSKYIVYDVFKMIFMILEIRNTEDYNLAEIFIVDLENITMGHVVKYTLPAIKKLEISALVSQCRILSYRRNTPHSTLRRLYELRQLRFKRLWGWSCRITGFLEFVHRQELLNNQTT
jgi:hypothetical protein